MSGSTLGNVGKLLLALVLFPFLAFLLLVIGVANRNKRVALEGAAYAAVFGLALTVPEESGVYGLAAFLGVGALIASVVRSLQMRDLWLRTGVKAPPASARGHESGQLTSAQPQAGGPLSRSSTEDLSSALAWVTSHAKQNKHRLPPDAYVTILETCNTLDAVIDAERQQPVSDARFEYELEAMVREYLPAVVQGYLAIPPSMVDKRQPNGRTPNEELAEQLQLLSGQADALHTSRHSHSSADLTSTGNFLRERFGHHQRGGFDFGVE